MNWTRQDHFGEFSNGVKLADGVKVSAYDVTPDVPYYANATMISGNFSSGLHDVRSGHINILGYLNDSAQYDKEYTTNISISSESKKGNRKIIFKATKDEVRNLPITAELPTSGGFGNDQSVYNLGDILTLSLNAGGTLSNTSIYRPGINLDAGGILEGKPNKTVTDLAGGKWQAPTQIIYKKVKDPIVYFTVPDQMEITRISGSNSFYTVKSAQGDVPKPKISRKHNSDGQEVIILDWTGTGFELGPTDSVSVNVQVRSDALNGFDTNRTTETLYAYEDKANNKIGRAHV